MHNEFSAKKAFKNFIKLFEKHKLLVTITITSVIISAILSIIVPLKIGKIIDTVLDNITIKSNNQAAIKIIDSLQPFIKDIENINFEALQSLDNNITVKDLVSGSLIQEKSINLLDDNIKPKILNTNVFELQDINCYECDETKNYIKPVKAIYSKVNEKVNINIQEIEIKNIIIDSITVVALIIIIFLINYLANLSMCKISRKITYDLRSKINSKLFKISLKDLTNYKEGDILSLITNDLDNISNTISTEIIDIIASVIQFISLTFIMFKLSTKLSFLIILIIPNILIMLVIIIIKSSKYFKQNQDNLGFYNDFILNSYNGYKTIRSYNQKSNFIKKEEKINKDLYINTWKSNFYSGLMQPIVQFAGNLNFLIVSIFGSMLVIDGKITIGNLQAFLTYAKNYNSPLVGLASTIGIIEQALASSERVYHFLNIEEENEDYEEENIDYNQDISFENVDFAYTDKKVLDNINFTIKKGEKIAIVGETGSGKTTLIKLLLNLYQPTKGTIKIGNKDISSINKRNLRDNIGVILQDSWLFEGSIEENINYGSPKNFKLLKDTSRHTHLDKIINKLPDKYKYYIDENNQLSKGEKQLISIARIFMTKKNILILDEATSNIDIETELTVRDATNELMKDKTCLIIAHRLSTIINSDKIIVMHKGKIVEQGTHQELLNAQKYYYKLYKSQYE